MIIYTPSRQSSLELFRRVSAQMSGLREKSKKGYFSPNESGLYFRPNERHGLQTGTVGVVAAVYRGVPSERPMDG